MLWYNYVDYRHLVQNVSRTIQSVSRWHNSIKNNKIYHLNHFVNQILNWKKLKKLILNPTTFVKNSHNTIHINNQPYACYLYICEYFQFCHNGEIELDKNYWRKIVSIWKMHVFHIWIPQGFTLTAFFKSITKTIRSTNAYSSLRMKLISNWYCNKNRECKYLYKERLLCFLKYYFLTSEPQNTRALQIDWYVPLTKIKNIPYFCRFFLPVLSVELIFISPIDVSLLDLCWNPSPIEWELVEKPTRLSHYGLYWS